MSDETRRWCLGDSTYRYLLKHWWDSSVRLHDIVLPWICVNPSTADETADDPSVRKIRGFTERLGFPGFLLANAFAVRATDPSDMKKHAAPIGPENDHHLRTALRTAPIVICAWGSHGGFRNRDMHVMKLIAETSAKPMCLGTTKDGFPRHPLMLGYDAQLVEYKGR